MRVEDEESTAKGSESNSAVNEGWNRGTACRVASYRGGLSFELG